MRGQTHHPRGRLRLRFSELRNHPLRLGRVCDELRAIEGVQLIEASQLNGSILIHYDARQARGPGFWDAIEAVLERNRLYPHAAPVEPSRASASDVGIAVANSLADTLVKKLVERSAMALVAAIL